MQMVRNFNCKWENSKLWFIHQHCEEKKYTSLRNQERRKWLFLIDISSWYVMLFTTKYNHLLSVIITDTIHFVPSGSLCHQQTKRNSLSANRLKETEFLHHLRIHFVPKCHYNIVTARKIEAAAEKKLSLRPMANTMKTRFTGWKDECSECQ